MAYRFNITSGDLNSMEANRPPAIVQPATRDWKFYENAIKQLDGSRGKMYKEYKDSGSWKAQYKTWKDACVPLGISASQADRLIKEENDASCVNEPAKEKEVTLNAVSKLPEPPKEESEERPAVHSADEKVHAEKVRENGKPKTSLHVWKTMEEYYGHALPMVDGLNRQCPNPSRHGRLLAATKLCMAELSAWHKETK